MEELKNWIPLIIQTIATITAIVWFFAKLDKRIALLENKFDYVCSDIKEIKNNHLLHLSEDIKELNEKLNKHLQKHI